MVEQKTCTQSLCIVIVHNVSYSYTSTNIQRDLVLYVQHCGKESLIIMIEQKTCIHIYVHLLVNLRYNVTRLLHSCSNIQHSLSDGVCI